MEFRLADPDIRKIAPGTHEVELVAIEKERLTFAIVDPKTNEQAKSWRNAVTPIRDLVEEMSEAISDGSPCVFSSTVEEWIDKLNTVCP